MFELKIKNKKWKCKYLKKTLNENTLHLYEKLKIEKYLNQLFRSYGIIVHNLNVKIAKTFVYLFISYYNTVKTTFITNNINYTQKIKQIKRVSKKNSYLWKSLKKRRLKQINSYKKFLSIMYFKTKKKSQKNSFIKKLLKGVKTFIKNQIIILTLQNLNKEFFFKLKKIETKLFKKVMFSLRQNIKYSFFKESINIILIVINKKKSSRFLSNFISYEIHKTTKTRHHIIFLTFLEKTILFFFKTNFCKINGIKITIKGKLNGQSRTKKYNLLVGKIPENSLSSIINYNKSTTFSIIGTFGIKICICEK